MEARPARFERALEGASRRLLSEHKVLLFCCCTLHRVQAHVAAHNCILNGVYIGSTALLLHIKDVAASSNLWPFIAEAIDVPWGLPASFNQSRYRDVAAVVGDTVTIHWNHTAGGQFSLWKIPSGADLELLKGTHALTDNPRCSLLLTTVHAVSTVLQLCCGCQICDDQDTSTRQNLIQATQDCIYLTLEEDMYP